jgi:hypothetical protein
MRHQSTEIHIQRKDKSIVRPARGDFARKVAAFSGKPELLRRFTYAEK